ncbi:MAG: pyridoxal-phosphate dependent enzyme [Planctomycetia bacterium]|nr:pyridoxal-phosphate dependent enzyme [Planctomycetia bacterium]
MKKTETRVKKSSQPKRTSLAFQRCINPDCGATYDITEVHHYCPKCGSLLDADYEWDKLPVPKNLKHFEKYWKERNILQRFSGVWRFQELLPFAPLEKCVSIGEGQTILQQAFGVAPYVGLDPKSLYLQYEGLNPSGSFKDNGMSAGMTHGTLVGAKQAVCASTGNTSASLAIYCAATKLMNCVIFIGDGKIAYGKLSQALDYGARTVQIHGDFDDAMARVQEVSRKLGIYLLNSVNPFRLEGQKTIMFRVLEALRWNVPDWIIVPGGNLGNSSSFGKAFIELHKLGLIKKVPRLAVINASGADTLYRLFEQENLRWNGGRPDKKKINAFFKQMTAEGRHASTIASAIEINRPVNLVKCLRALDFCNGVVRSVSEQEILDAKAQIGASGFGCEPASAASVAGAKKLVEEGVIGKDERVVCVLTGYQLKDPNATVAYHGTNAKFFKEVLGSHGVKSAPFANHPVSVDNDIKKILDLMR